MELGVFLAVSMSKIRVIQVLFLQDSRPAASSIMEPLTQSPLIAEAVKKNKMNIGHVTAGEWFERRIKNQRTANQTVSCLDFDLPLDSPAYSALAHGNRVPKRGEPPVGQSTCLAQRNTQ